MKRQHVKLTVVLVAVVLALTGFSTGSHGSKSRSGKSRSSHSSGGGCSNSKKSNGTYHDTDSGTRYNRTSGGTSNTRTSPTPTATAAPKAYVFRCAAPAKGAVKAVTASTVRLTANASGSHTYNVDVNFLDASGVVVDTGRATADASRGETKTVSVQMDHPDKVARVAKCAVTAAVLY
ncbi:hypothetical protein [Streptomyces sp. NPDC086838]|uniref:hypothetical protein n=1 Tax=Streptomyces sp. NPDC086838 TaxID=3365762 RepID=UPI00381F98BE